MARAIEKKKIDGYIHYRCHICDTWYKAKDRRYKHTCSTECSTSAFRTAIEQLRNKAGPIYEKWRSRMLAGMEHYRAQL